MNGLLLLLQHCAPSLARTFLPFIGAPVYDREALLIRDHVPYGPDSIVDGEVLIPGRLCLAIEAKIYEGQFEEPEQVERYLQLLQNKEEPKCVLLLLSPDVVEPPIVALTTGQSSANFITWRSWGEVYRFLERERSTVDQSAQPAQFLINQYLQYLEALGLKGKDAEETQNNQRLEPQLHFLLGNVAAEKILLHLFHHGGGHVRGIARDYAIGLGATQRVLKRFVQAGLIKKETKGHVVWYTFDPKSPFVKLLLELVRIVYESIPEPSRKATFEPTYRRHD